MEDRFVSALDLTLASEPVRVRRMEVIMGDVGHRTWCRQRRRRGSWLRRRYPGSWPPKWPGVTGLRPQQMFGWRREARAASHFQEEGLVFAPVVLDTTPPPAAPKELPAIEVQIGDAVVRVPAGMDSATVKAVLRAVRALR